MANKSSQQKVTRSGKVYNNEQSTVAEDTPALPIENNTPSITRSGEIYQKPTTGASTADTNDIKNTPEFKKARAKYDDKKYNNLSNIQKDRLAEKDVEDAHTAPALAQTEE